MRYYPKYYASILFLKLLPIRRAPDTIRRVCYSTAHCLIRQSGSAHSQTELDHGGMKTTMERRRLNVRIYAGQQRREKNKPY